MSISGSSFWPRPVRTIFRVRFLTVAAVLLIAGLFAVLGGARAAPKNPPSSTQARAADGEYTGSGACARCHKEIYDQFSRTGMGRSMSQVTPALITTLRTSGSVENKNPDLHLEVYARDGKLYQTEFEMGDGKEIFRDTHEVEWMIGAGENGFGGLVKRDNYIFQAPLSFYSKPQAWGLSPGYEFGNYGFNRPILPACIFCHSGRPNAVLEGNGRFENPPFAELAIGCENCHGPGLSHVVAIETGLASYQGRDSSIVNPARLPPALADNICMSC